MTAVLEGAEQGEDWDAARLAQFTSKRQTAKREPTTADEAAPPAAAAPKAKRKQFQAEWARLPRSWLVALRRTKSASVKQLAMEILFAEFQRKHTGGEIVLSAAVTGLGHPTRIRAIEELVRLGLIEVEQHGREAARVIRIDAG